MLAKYLLALASLASTALAVELSIATPVGYVTCQPGMIFWQGGVGPYHLSLLPAGQAQAQPIKDFGELGAQISAYTWLVDVPAGKMVTLRITDSEGGLAYTSPFTAAVGKSDDCLRDAVS